MSLRRDNSGGSASLKAALNTPQPHQPYIRASPPSPIPEPGLFQNMIQAGPICDPWQISIVDFYLDMIRRPEDLVINRVSRDELLKDDAATLATVIKDKPRSGRPGLRWVHLPWNSMQDAEVLMSKVARDVGLKSKVVPEAIMSLDKWDHRLHKREANDGYHSIYMQPTCMEIGIRHRYLIDTSAAGAAKAHKFRHRGANMALFMPFLHWGSENLLSWREDKIRLIEDRRSVDPRGPLPELVQPDDSPTDRFHTMLMEEQLNSEKPLHLRRTLDQFFYTNIKDTSDRDHDQVLSKYGPEDGKAGFRPILMVDQLWLWILGGETVVTCFDRRWENDHNFHANVLDRLLQWKLPNAATRIKTAYDLAHIIIDEASGFFFSSTSSLPRSLRFAEVFRGAIGSVNSEQTRLFRALETLTHKGPAFELTRREQNELLSMQAEFGLVREVRDLVDELTMIRHVYDAQLLLLDPLFDMQYSDALFRAGLTDLFGNLLRPSDGDGVESAVEIASPSASFGFGAEGTPDNGGSDTSSRVKGKGELQREREEQRQAMAVPIRWDERGWFNRTAQYMRRHREMIQDMMDDTEKVYTALQGTIGLKQNSASLFEAHSSRREGEAVMVFTLVTSFMLPLSFFSSVFGMNVVELIGPNGTMLTFGAAMAYMIPLSVLIISIFVLIAFKSDVVEWTAGRFTKARPSSASASTAGTRSLASSSQASSKKTRSSGRPDISRRKSSSYGSVSV